MSARRFRACPRISSRSCRAKSAADPRVPPATDELLLAGYGIMSAAASIVVMRGQGLGWAPIAALTLSPLAILEAARRHAPAGSHGRCQPSEVYVRYFGVAIACSERLRE